VLSPVVQHVDQRIPHLSRRAELAGVIPISPHGTAAAQQAVDGASQPDRQALNAADEARVRISLDEQVHVVGLHTEVHNAEASPRRRRK
jgi:hypothetical protein